MKTQERANRLYSEIIKTRDRCCQSCGVGGDLEAHHLFLRSVTNWLIQYDPDYGIALCSTCHQGATRSPSTFRGRMLIRLRMIPAERDFLSDFYAMIWEKYQVDGAMMGWRCRAEKIAAIENTQREIGVFRADWRFIRAVLRAELIRVKAWAEDNSDCEPGYGRTLI